MPRLRERARSAVPHGAGRLPGYRLAFTRKSTRWGGLAADIVPDPSAEVWGALISLDPSDVGSLDEAEFIGTGYRRVGVRPLIGPEWRQVAAFSYEVIDKQPEGSPPPHYLDAILVGAEEAGLPAHWIRYLQSFA